VSAKPKTNALGTGGKAFKTSGGGAEPPSRQVGEEKGYGSRRLQKIREEIEKRKIRNRREGAKAKQVILQKSGSQKKNLNIRRKPSGGRRHGRSRSPIKKDLTRLLGSLLKD